MTKETQRLSAFALIALMILTWALPTERRLFASSLTDIKQVLAVTDVQIRQMLNLRLLGFVIGALFSGALCDHIGRRTVLRWGTLSYCLSSLLCAMSHSFAALMMCRFLQGLTIAGPLIASYTMIFDGTSGRRQILWMSTGNSIATLCLMGAPFLGDVIGKHFGYQGNLWTILAIGMIGSMPALIWTKETLTEKGVKKLSLWYVFSGYVKLCEDRRFVMLAFPVCALMTIGSIYMEASLLYIIDHLGIHKSHFRQYETLIFVMFALSSALANLLLRRFTVRTTIHIGITAMCIGIFQFFPAVGALSLFSVVANWFLWRFPFKTGICIALAITLSIFSLLFYGSLFLHKSIVCTAIFMAIFASGLAIAVSILFPLCTQHLSNCSRGKAQGLIQTAQFVTATLAMYVMTFAYSGPSLPVATALAILLSASLTLLCRGKKFIEDEPEPELTNSTNRTSRRRARV